MTPDTPPDRPETTAAAVDGPAAAPSGVAEDRPTVRWFDRLTARKGLKPRYAAYIIIVFWLIGVVVFGLIEFLVDRETFPTVWLGMWWAIQTVTTVGYGDIVPNQPEGQVVAAFLMLGGLSLLSVITATITSGFVGRAREQRMAEGKDPVMRRLEELSAQLDAVQAELSRRPAGPDDDRPTQAT